MACYQNSGIYKKLCNYDDFTDDCVQQAPPREIISFQCVDSANGRQCVRMSAAPGPGYYSNIAECQQNCGQLIPSELVSFQCVDSNTGKQCVRMNVAPGPGSYSNMADCAQNCNAVPLKNVRNRNLNGSADCPAKLGYSQNPSAIY